MSKHAESAFLAGSKPFADKYPEIEAISVEVTEGGRLWDSPLSRTTATYAEEDMDYLGNKIKCSNPDCVGGGYPVDLVIRRMVGERERTLEDTRKCQGKEGSPEGRRTYGPCDNSFHLKILINYKE